jgi:hypothetical protein
MSEFKDLDKIEQFFADKLEKVGADPWAKKGLSGPPAIKPNPPKSNMSPLAPAPKLKPPGMKLDSAGAPPSSSNVGFGSIVPNMPSLSNLPAGDEHPTSFNPEKASIPAEPSDLTPAGVAPKGGDFENQALMQTVHSKAFKPGLNSLMPARVNTAERVMSGLSGPNPEKAKASLGGKYGVANLGQLTNPKPKLPMAGFERLKMSEEEFTKMDKFFKKEEMSKSEILKELKLILNELKKTENS